MTDFYDNNSIYRLNDKVIFGWTRPKNTFRNFEISDKVLIYFQFKNIGADDRRVKNFIFNVIENGNDDYLGYEADKRYYENQKDSDGLIVKVNRISPNGFEMFGIDDNTYTTKEFLELFSDYIDIKIQYLNEDLV